MLQYQLSLSEGGTRITTYNDWVWKLETPAHCRYQDSKRPAQEEVRANQSLLGLKVQDVPGAFSKSLRLRRVSICI